MRIRKIFSFLSTHLADVRIFVFSNKCIGKFNNNVVLYLPRTWLNSYLCQKVLRKLGCCLYLLCSAVLHLMKSRIMSVVVSYPMKAGFVSLLVSMDSILHSYVFSDKYGDWFLRFRSSKNRFLMP